MRKIISLLMKPKKMLNSFAWRGYLKWIPDKIYLKIFYFIKHNKKLSLENPTTYNEKLQWLKIYDRKKEYTRLVDKYEVRKYISEKVGGNYLIPLLGVYNSFNEIEFSKLPSQFVLKSTHDSGGIVICKDKNKFDIEKAKEIINKSLKRNYYNVWREWPYKNVKPRIICEKYMVEESGKDLEDYKFMCFNGKVKCTFVCQNRKSSTGMNIDIYDPNWKLMPIQRPSHPNSGIQIDKPHNYIKMIELAETLSKDIAFLRVDFYEIDGQIYFGELTFYPGSGFEKFTPESYDEILGSWIKLPFEKENSF